MLNFRISCVVVLGCLSSAALSAERPNIVIIYADDMGYGDLAVQNPDSKIPTPHLDRLASQGMRFTDAHSSSGICTPSRYALLSGRYHWRKFHGIVNAWGESVFAAERLTLPEMLKGQGYTTACIGKWHLGFDWKAIRKPDAQMVESGGRKTWGADAFDWHKAIPDGPLDHGFDYYFGDDVPNFPPYTWIENDRVVVPPTVPYVPNPAPSEGSPEGRPGPMVAGWRQDEVMPTLTDKVVHWLEQQQGNEQPFFLYWPWTSPHAPIVPAAQWQGKTEAGGFGDFVAQSDDHAGQVLKALDDYGFTDNTLVIFTADNGPERYAYDRIKNYGHHSTGPLRGLKRDVWEGGHRVPFIVRWPQHVTAGSVSAGLMSQVDIMGTLAAILDISLPAGQADDSYNQLSLWQGGESARDSIVHNTFAKLYAIRRGSWLLVDGPSGNSSAVPAWFDQEFEYSANQEPGLLNDLATDVGQHYNLYAEQPERVRELKALLKEKQSHGEVR
ncbi:sulfatase family protein [Aureliella helgolandensis]|uniref:Arylsulfatase n=1 Tax=Aureliella helgolandensis TaxID=2527968 RepID=A0A518G3D7_9BACT|nr:arylsulfatase [Aureliella helgolandensis]QDV23117.1 Arylsulfatase [Aureliella helgolandensis]